MSWSYNPEQGANLDKLRFMLGDTLAYRKLLHDEEIKFLLTKHSDDLNAAGAEAAKAIAHKIMGDPNFSRGSWSENKDRVVENYLALSAELSASRISGAPFTVSAPEPYFDRGMMDFPSTPTGNLTLDEDE